MADSTPTSAPALLTVKQAADRLSVSIWTIYSLLDDGSLRGVYQGRRRYVPSEAIGEYVESLSSTPQSA